MSDLVPPMIVEIFYLRLLVSSSRCYTGIIFSTVVRLVDSSHLFVMSNKGKKKKKRKVHDQIQPSSDKTTSSVFGRSDIHSILSNTGEYSDTSSDDDVQSQSSTSVSDDDECVSPSPEHSDGDGDNGDGDFLPAKDKHSNKRKKVLPQCDINSKKSKVNSSEVIIENTSIATASQHDGSKKV